MCAFATCSQASPVFSSPASDETLWGGLERGKASACAHFTSCNYFEQAISMSILKFFKKAASPEIVPEDKGTDSAREEEPVLTPSGKADLVIQSLDDSGSPSDKSTGPPAAKRQDLCSDHDCGDMASVVGLRSSMLTTGITFSLTTSSQVLISFPKQASGCSFQL